MSHHPRCACAECITRRRMEITDADIAEALAAVLRPLRCPWCQNLLRVFEMHYRPKLGEPPRPHEQPPVYMACEPCAWDMDGVDVPPFRIVH